MTLDERLRRGEVTVVEQGREDGTDGRFTYYGEYRILSDGRRQWRQLQSDGKPCPAWKWMDS